MGSRKGKIIVLVIVILLLLAGGGVAVWYFTGDDYHSKKNMKLAEEAFADGQLEEAEEYYEAALEYDATLKDAYINLAGLEIKDHKYEAAIRTLHKGLENTTEVEGATAQLLEELVEVYNRMAQESIDKKEYDQALILVARGHDETGSPKLKDRKTEIYQLWIDSCLEEENYNLALQKVKYGYDVTGNDLLLDRKEEIYLKWAEDCIANRDYPGTMQALKDGLADTGSAALEAKIKEVKEKRILVSEKRFDVALNSTDEYYYDSKGRQIEIVYGKVGGGVAQRETYAYDDAGNVIEFTLYAGEDIQVTRMLYEWTEVEGKKRCVSTRLDAEGNMICRYVEEDAKPISEEEYYGENGALSLFRQYEYDEAGNLLKEVVVSEGKTTVDRYEHTYDEAGNLRESVYLDEEDNVLHRRACDAAGNEIESVQYEGGEIVYSAYRTFDERGNMLTEDILSLLRYEEEDNHTEYIYGEDNEVIEHVYIDNFSGYEEKTVYDRIEDGNTETKEIKTYENGELTEHHVVYTTYDEEGKIFHIKKWDEEEQYFFEEIVYENDEDGNQIYYRHSSYGNDWEYWTEYEYGFPE